MAEVRIFVAVLAKVAKVSGGKKSLVESLYWDKNMCHRTSQIPSSKLLKTKNDQNGEKDRQCRGCCLSHCLESQAAKPDTAVCL
jgi:hypothetical protein